MSSLIAPPIRGRGSVAGYGHGPAALRRLSVDGTSKSRSERAPRAGPLGQRTVTRSQHTGRGIDRLRSLHDVDAIDVSLDDALGFGCNLVSDGQTVITSAAAPRLVGELRAHGFEVIGLPVTQFMLAGGGVRCLGLDLPS